MYYLAEAVPDSKAKELRIITAYINKEGEYQMPDAKAPSFTSGNEVELSPSISNISQSSENVNTQNQKNSTGRILMVILSISPFEFRWYTKKQVYIGIFV